MESPQNSTSYPFAPNSQYGQCETVGYETVLCVQDLFEPLTSSSFANLSTLSTNENQHFCKLTRPRYSLDSHDEFKFNLVEPTEPTNDSQSKNSNENWRLRITIPEPFKMTLREAIRDEVKPKICKRVQKDLEFSKEIDEVEGSKIFRANPVPPGTYIPRYSEMLKKEETRKQLRKEKSRELTLATQKPFDFYFREEVKKFFRSKSMPNLEDTSLNTTRQSRVSPNQRHKRHKSVESPRKYFSNSVRKSNSTTIPKSVLLNASMPEMSLKNIRLKLQASRDWSMLMKWSADQQRNNAVKRILNPPNFKAIHADLAIKQQKHFPIRVTTTCEPFTLHTSNITSHINRVKEDIKQDEEKLKETRWPFVGSRAPFRSSTPNYKVPSSPPKLNLAAKLRVENNSKQMANRSEEKFNVAWKNQLRRTLSAKIAAEAAVDSTEDKIRRRKAEVKSQLLDYQFELDEMTKRVASRPLLMEQQSTMAARKRAERIFLEKLRDHGLSEEFVVNKSSALKNGEKSASSMSRASSSATLKRSRSDTSSRRESFSSINIATQTIREPLNSQGDESITSDNSNDTVSQ